MVENAPTPSPDPPLHGPLHGAARREDVAAIKELLGRGADPSARDKDGATALFHAGSPEVARALITGGVHLHAVNSHDCDALQYILEGGSWEVRNRQGPERFRVTRFQVAQVLLAAGADLERRGQHGQTRLHRVAFARDEDAVEFLLAAGADPLAQDDFLDTPLHAVCWWGGPAKDVEGENGAVARIIGRLVAAGVPIDQPDAEGWTPLHEAAGGDWGCPAAVGALLRRGATVDPRDRHGRTPLMLAADYDEPECVWLLLAAGADPTLTDAHGWNALDYARDPGERYVNEEDRGPPDRAGPGSGDNPECVRLLAEALRQRAP